MKGDGKHEAGAGACGSLRTAAQPAFQCLSPDPLAAGAAQWAGSSHGTEKNTQVRAERKRTGDPASRKQELDSSGSSEEAQGSKSWCKAQAKKQAGFLRPYQWLAANSPANSGQRTGRASPVAREQRQAGSRTSLPHLFCLDPSPLL